MARARQSPQFRFTAAKSVSFSGWLYKAGNFHTAFKLRWFVLDQGVAAYYETEKSKTPKGEFGLLGATAQAVEGGESSGRFRFEVVVLEKSRRGRKYVLEAKDAAARDAWLANLALGSTPEDSGVRAIGTDATLEAVVGPPPARSWRDEWVAMRSEQLRLEGDSGNATRKNCGPGGQEGMEKWAKTRRDGIRFKLGHGWSQEDAEGYTLITGCNRAALARAVRERDTVYAASMHLVLRSLAAGATRMEAPAPPLYYVLCGQHGLATADAAWAVLLQPDVAPGLSFVTTSPALGRDDKKCIPNPSGYHERMIDRSGSPAGYDLQVSPVVRFVSAAAEGEVLRTLVNVAPSRWELPPLATVTLQRIDPPGAWGAHGAPKVDRTLYTVSVSWRVPGQ